MNGQMDGQIDRQIDRWMEGQMDRFKIDEQIVGQIEYIDIWIERKLDIKIQQYYDTKERGKFIAYYEEMC